jgi:YegS/Rv2252/BmrU family lipid kinase
MHSPVKLRFIVNARSGRAKKALPEVGAFAAQHNAGIVVTQRPGHGAELAAQALADGCDLIAAVGGDGTMNEVASALIDRAATLALIPCGSGDGLGRHLRIHGTVAHALAVLEHGAPRRIDTGTADGHPFFTAAGIGFEAEIAHRFNRLERRGFLRYLTTSLAALRQWQPETYAITADGIREQLRAFTLTVANADQYGNDAQIAPGARADDGLLALTAIPPVTMANALPLVIRLFCHRIHGARGVVSRAGTHFVVERSAPGLLHTDGELHQAGRVVEFQIRPASLRIMCPVDEPPQTATNRRRKPHHPDVNRNEPLRSESNRVR